MEDHTGTSAVVTGGSQGLGFAIALRLIEEGCRKIVIVGRNVAKGEGAAEKLRKRGCTQAYFLQADLSNADSVNGIIKYAVEKLSFVNSLVNCAADTSREKLLQTTAIRFDRMMAVNVRAPILLTEALARHLIESQSEGSIVNIGSTAWYCGPIEMVSYSSSKAALVATTRNLAHTLRKNRIRVNCINVGWMDTPAEDDVQKEWHGKPDNWLQLAEKEQPFGSLVKPHQVARQVALFLSLSSGVVTGSIVDWDQNVLGGTHVLEQ